MHPETVAVSPCPLKRRVPVYCGVGCIKNKVVPAGVLATPSTAYETAALLLKLRRRKLEPPAELASAYHPYQGRTSLSMLWRRGGFEVGRAGMEVPSRWAAFPFVYKGPVCRDTCRPVDFSSRDNPPIKEASARGRISCLRSVNASLASRGLLFSATTRSEKIIR